MKIKFLKDVTTTVYKDRPDFSGVYEMIIQQDKSYEVQKIFHFPSVFSTIYLPTGEVFIVETDSFVETE